MSTHELQTLVGVLALVFILFPLSIIGWALFSKGAQQ